MAPIQEELAAGGTRFGVWMRSDVYMCECAVRWVDVGSAGYSMHFVMMWCSEHGMRLCEL